MFKKIKKLFSGRSRKKEISDAEPESEINKAGSETGKIENTPEPVARDKVRTALVFDTKRRIFITKRKTSRLALWCPDKQQIILVDEVGEQKTFPVTLVFKEDETVIPITGYWTENSEAGVGFYFPARGLFQLKNNIFQQGCESDLLFIFGPDTEQWQPIAGDWDADGIATIGLYDKENAKFLLQNEHKGAELGELEFHFGPRNYSWIPVAGDWNGDGRTTVGLYDAEEGIAMLQNAHEGGEQPDIRFVIADSQSHWQPIVGEWGDGGVDSLAFWDAETEQFHLRYSNENGAIDQVIQMASGEKNVVPISILCLFA